MHAFAVLSATLAHEMDNSKDMRVQPGRLEESTIMLNIVLAMREETI